MAQIHLDLLLKVKAEMQEDFEIFKAGTNIYDQFNNRNTSAFICDNVIYFSGGDAIKEYAAIEITDFIRKYIDNHFSFEEFYMEKIPELKSLLQRITFNEGADEKVYEILQPLRLAFLDDMIANHVKYFGE